MKIGICSRVFLCLLFSAWPAVSAQTLPSGAYHPNRERTYDLQHYRADLTVDFQAKTVQGEAVLTLVPLREPHKITLDAVHLNVSAVTCNGKNLAFTSKATHLEISLPDARVGTPLDLVVTYACSPKSGISFHPSSVEGEYFVSTFGEGGLHNNVFPIYNGLNDKFTTELILTVPTPYQAVANGTLVSEKAAGKDRRRFHWKQARPHAVYLMAFYIGIFEKASLPSGKNGVPLAWWVQKGRGAEAVHTFRNTGRMMDFYEELLDMPYPWEKYDQIVVPGFAPFAMEHTSVTGHDDTLLYGPNTPDDFNFVLPGLDWSIDYIVAHELAHHWFGNNVTCRDLSYIWLNEGITTYMGLAWEEARLGRDHYLYAMYKGREFYRDYVRAAHLLRPLEYPYYDHKDAIFDVPITYMKGGAFMHMMRHILGDQGFYATLRHYLNKHAFGNVVSNDLKIAAEEATGVNLSLLFDQWVTGGGYPQFEVGYTYYPDRKVIDLSVQQVQPIIKGQGLFTLPVDITIATARETFSVRLDITEAAEDFLIACDDTPLMVSFDGDGDLIMDLTFAKSSEELLYQVEHDALPGRLWALARLDVQPGDDTVLQTLQRLASGESHWGIRAEAVRRMAAAGERAASAAETALTDPVYQVRMAAVDTYAALLGAGAVDRLKRVVANDENADVVAQALNALSGLGVDSAYFASVLPRPSWNGHIAAACLAALAATGETDNLPRVLPYTGPTHNAFLRMAAFQAWQDLNAADPALHRALIAAVDDRDYYVQGFAVAKVGELLLAEGLPALKAVIASDADATLAAGAAGAIARIERLNAPAPERPKTPRP